MSDNTEKVETAPESGESIALDSPLYKKWIPLVAGLGLLCVVMIVVGVASGASEAGQDFNIFQNQWGPKDLLKHAYVANNNYDANPTEKNDPGFMIRQIWPTMYLSMVLFIGIVFLALTRQTTRLQRGFILTYSIFLLALVDLISKTYIFEHFQHLRYGKPMFTKFVYFTYRENTGAAWSFMEGHPGWLAVMSIATIIFVFIFYITSPKSKGLDVAFTLIIAGAAGNLYDRYWFGYVRDFVDMRGFDGKNIWPVFNVADSYIVMGALIVLTLVFLEHRAEKLAERQAALAEKEKSEAANNANSADGKGDSQPSPTE